VVRRRELRNVGLILVSTDKGLCGGLNTNIQRAGARADQGVGRRRRQAARNRDRQQGAGVPAATARRHQSHVIQLGDRPILEKLIGPVKVQLDAYSRGEVDGVYLAYSRFVNTMKQETVIEQLLPLSAERFAQSEEERRAYAWDYLYEPDRSA